MRESVQVSDRRRGHSASEDARERADGASEDARERADGASEDARERADGASEDARERADGALEDARERADAIKQCWRSSVSPLGLLICLSFGPVSPGVAETLTPEGKSQEQQLDPVEVVAPRPRPPRQQATPAPQPAPLTTPKPARIRAPAPTPARAPRPAPAAASGNGQGNDATTPLNTGAVAESASRLGLTVRQIPASVEVIDQKTLTDRGLHTTTEAAQAATRRTPGVPPRAPPSFSMRGFSGTQINTLYNGIKIGPSEMTGRVMDTANLEQIEFLKGPASLMSGEGATGGAINYVNKKPHIGKIVNDAFTSFDSFYGFPAGFRAAGR